MAAVCQTLVSIDHEDEPSRYAMKVACVRCLSIAAPKAAARVIAHTQSQSEGYNYHYPAGGIGINTRETTGGTGEGGDVDSFGLFDVLMDAVDFASSDDVITSDLYGKVSLFLIILYGQLDRRPVCFVHR